MDYFLFSQFEWSFSLLVRSALVGFLLFLVLPYGCVVSSDGYELAVKTVRESSVVQTRVGFVKNVKVPFPFGFTSECDKPFSRADMTLKVTGVRSSTYLQVHVAKLADGWHLGDNLEMDGRSARLGPKTGITLRDARGCRGYHSPLDPLYLLQYVLFFALTFGWEWLTYLDAGR